MTKSKKRRDRRKRQKLRSQLAAEEDSVATEATETASAPSTDPLASATVVAAVETQEESSGLEALETTAVTDSSESASCIQV